MRCALLLLLFVGATNVAGQRDGRLFHTRQFWDGFERGMMDAGVEVQRRLDSNLEVAMDTLSGLGDSLGSLSKRIEEQVQDSLPDWLQDSQQSAGSASRVSHSPNDAPIEAVEGSLGHDGLDDGLLVYFDGDSKSGKLPEPHVIPGSPLSEDTNPDAIPPPRTGGPLFDLRFGFPYRLPIFPRNPDYGMNRDFWFRAALPQPWWRGDNVCVEEEVINETEENDAPTSPGVDSIVADAEADEPATEVSVSGDDETREGRSFFFGQMEIKSCSETRDKYTCTTRMRRRGVNRTLKQVYRCCHGYIREAYGCTRVNLVPLADSLEGLGLTDFLSLVKSAEAVDLLNSGNLTVFAPTNEAVQDYTADLAEKNELDLTENEVYRRKRQVQDNQGQKTVYTHLTEGFLYAGDLEDEQVIPSLSSDSTIRVNVYGNTVPPTITVNCARIITANQHSTNGVVHTIDRVISPAERSIADIIGSDPQFTILKKLVSNSGMLTQLREAGQYTLLAPTDAAFSSLPNDQLQRLMEASACLPSILQNHILPNVICSAAITNPEAKTINLLEKYLMVKLDDAGKLFVENAQVVAKDIMATNGIIHIIDAPIMPTEALPVLDVLKQKNFTKFLELLELAELSKELETLRDVTIFAPSNAAIERLPESHLNEFKSDPERLKEMLRYHITSTPFNARDVQNNHLTDTVAGHPLRINLYRGPVLFSLDTILNPSSSARMRMTAGCGMVTFQDSRACGAAIHVIDELLQPAKHSVIEKLDQTPEFSIFSQLVKESTMAEELSGPGPFTVLAPSDHVFKTLPEPELAGLMEDSELKDELVRRHILREHVCCSGIAPSMFPFRDHTRTAHGATLHLHQTPGGLLKAGGARITKCSEPGSNGLVHTVNSLYVEPHMPNRSSGHQRWGEMEPVVFRFPFLRSRRR